MEISIKQNNSNQIEDIDTIFDKDWLKSTFIIPDKDIIEADTYSKWVKKNRYFSTADYKFTSTSPGMNSACNPKPQFTRYCDIRSKGKLSRPDITVGTTGHMYGLGMGRYYSEAIDDNEQKIFLRFGTAQYLPLLLWLQKSFDINKVVLHNRGIITKTLLEGIGVISKLAAISTSPIFALGIFTINTIVQNNRFYSLKDTMYVYWATVENILNQLAVRRTMIPYAFEEFSSSLTNRINRERKTSTRFINNLNSLMPNIIDPETGRISVFAIALRAQAAHNEMRYRDMKLNESMNLSSDFTGYAETENNSHDTYFTNRNGEVNLFNRYLFKKAYDILMTEEEKNKDFSKNENPSIVDINSLYKDKNGNVIDLNINPEDQTDSIEKRILDNANNNSDRYSNYRKYILSELMDGAGFAVFNVENTGSINETFSNSVTQNPIEATFNSISSKARNITDLLSSASGIPVVGDIMKFAADAGAVILSNASYGIANPLLALAYGVNVSMPKVWESSSASLPRANYKIKLISPYGNAYSQLFNIYLPLSMILAGSLPRSTGSSTYTSPFLCQLFDRGRVNIQLGIIENVSITRGTSNLAFSRNGHPNAIDVDISIANLDEIIAIDVEDTGFLNKLFSNLSLDFSDTPFLSYINTVTAVDVYTQIYKIPDIILKLSERYANIKAVVNPEPAAFASFTVNRIPFGGIVREILSENSAVLDEMVNK